MRFLYCVGLMLTCDSLLAGEAKPLADSLLFHVSFDKSADADFAKGDRKLYTAKSLKREHVQAGLHSTAVRLDAKDGRYGGSLRCKKKSTEILFYRGGNNLPYSMKNFQGSYSFWLRVDPKEELPPGYVDPLQITDKKWNDASFFVDFTREKPRQFRLGVFSDFKYWNPENRKWDSIPAKERPLVSVTKPPFSNKKWTHVAITFSGFNSDAEGDAALYLDGELQGHIRKQQQITWNPDQVVIMLGIYYVGGIDDFAVFDRGLSESEVKVVFKLPKGISSLRNK